MKKGPSFLEPSASLDPVDLCRVKRDHKCLVITCLCLACRLA